jgi:hypothetical protein
MVWHAFEGVSSIDKWIWGKGINSIMILLTLDTAVTDVISYIQI